MLVLIVYMEYIPQKFANNFYLNYYDNGNTYNSFNNETDCKQNKNFSSYYLKN